jgi:hypothetical protein
VKNRFQNSPFKCNLQRYNAGFAVARSSTDAADGTYELSYTVTKAEVASLILTLVSSDGAAVSSAVASSPYAINVVAAAMDASTSALDITAGGGNVVAGNALVLPITAKDAFGNLARLVPAPVVAITLTPKFAGAAALTGTVSSVNEGTGTLQVTVPGNGVVAAAAGEYTLAASLTGVGGGALPVGGSPATVTVVAGGAVGLYKLTPAEGLGFRVLRP